MVKSLQDEIKQTRPFTSLEVEAYLNLVRTEATLTHRVNDIFKAHGITATLYNLLRIIRGGPEEGVPCSNIAERLVARVPDVTRLVDRAVALNLVVRHRPDTDRRLVLLRLEERGHALLEELEAPLDALHSAQMAGLSKTELKTLIALLTRLRDPG